MEQRTELNKKILIKNAKGESDTKANIVHKNDIDYTQKFSIIIPTLQKDLDILNKLVSEMDFDDYVGEIIIIDNSTKGYNHYSKKLKVIQPEQNIYVNPAWNLGIKNAKYELFGILNDDILLPKNFCTQILKFLKEDEKCGLIGLESSTSVETTKESFNEVPSEGTLEFRKINNIYDNKDYFWGSAFWGKKSSYYEIPEELKIYSGDNYLLMKNNKAKKNNYAVSGIKIKHYGSLSSASTEFSPIKAKDQSYMASICPHYRKHYNKQLKKQLNNSFIENIFSVKNTKCGCFKAITIFNYSIFLKNNNDIRFSIIMPTYNRAFCIENAINSLLNQTYQNYELIIIDDGSTDNTEKLLKEKYKKYFDSKKFIYKYKKNKGVCKARNLGLKLAKNEWIAYLDTDNTITPNFLETFNNTIEKNFHKYKTYYAQFKHPERGIVGKNFNYEELCKRNFIDLGIFVHHKKLTRKIGKFDTKLKRLVDWDLIIRYTEKYKPKFIQKVLLIYSNSNNYDRISTTESYQTALKRIQNKIKRIRNKKNILKNIFSIENNIKKTHKVITILGIKIKIKSPKLIQREHIKELEQKINNTNKQLKSQQEQIQAQQEILNKYQEQIVGQAKIIEQQCATMEQFYSWQQNFYKENPTEFPIRLSEAENLAITNLMNKSTNYLEFGSGGSTFLALNSNISKIYSVESDKKWLDYISSYKIISDAVRNNKLNLYHINIGKTKAWGFPINDDLKENYPKYSSDIFEQIPNIKDIDLVFIDGRFRVACALNSISKCKKDTTIMIHDYVKRNYYHIIEEFADLVETIDTLAVFKIKENINQNTIQNLYKDYQYVKE